MKTINQEKKVKSFKYFILITVMPIIGITVMSCYAYFHVRQDINFVSNEIRGIKVITQINKTIFDIQRIRGLTCMVNSNENAVETIESLKEKISNNLTISKQILSFITSDTILKEEFSELIDSVQISSFEYEDFDSLSKVIDDFKQFTNRIAYDNKLILEPYLDSYILIENIVYILPELLEYNGKVRAISSSIKDNSLTDEQKHRINIQLSRVKVKLQKLEFNMLLLLKNLQNNKINTIYENMKESQNKIINFVEKKLLTDKKISLEADFIFTHITKNINLIINLYEENLNILNNNLDKNLQRNEQLCIYIIFSGLISILFIIYINRAFYCKNRSFINKIEEMSITDDMTSLYNRRHFDEVFENHLKIEQRTGQTLVFIILDIDFFKEYNDTYGH